jgi:alpha-tubulin suppressor-like RCC1 family protein
MNTKALAWLLSLPLVVMLTAISPAQSIVAWGDDSGAQTNVPAGLTNAVTVSAYGGHSLALRADGTIAAWGVDNNIEISQMTAYADVPAWAPDGLTNAVAMATGRTHSLAVLSDGTVAVWSHFSSGQVTVWTRWGGWTTNLSAMSNSLTGFFAATNAPPGLSDIVAVAAGEFFSLALRANGTVVAWGRSDLNETMVPTNLANVVAVAAGADHSLALRADGTVVSWGWNDWGQANVPAGLTNVTGIAAGSAYSLALCEDGRVVAWGDNNYFGWGGETNVPVTLTNAVAIAASDYHSLALRADGTVVSWPEIPLPDGSPLSVPAGLSNVVSVAAGTSHDVVLINSGAPYPGSQRTSLNNPTHTTNRFSVQIASQNGRVYAMEYKDALTDPAWSALPLVAGNGEILTIIDPTAAGGQRYYRVRRW